MTTFYKFPDEGTYFKLKQEEIPVVVLGYVPNGLTETVIQVQEDGSGIQVESPLYHEGFHVNAMKEVPEWSEYELEFKPNTPWMIFG